MHKKRKRAWTITPAALAARKDFSAAVMFDGMPSVKSRMRLIALLSFSSSFDTARSSPRCTLVLPCGLAETAALNALRRPAELEVMSASVRTCE